MFARVRRLLSQFFRRSRTINNEPLNRVSLIVIILIDIFILINVFSGLDDISRWYISPGDAYPCYREWQNYRSQTVPTKDYDVIQLALPDNLPNRPPFQQSYQQAEIGHLGKVSQTCLQYATYKDQINNAANQQTAKTIDQQQAQIDALNQANQKIRAQYDSTLLEEIAGQPREQSINSVGAAQARRTIDQNNQKISTLKNEVAALKSGLLKQPESVNFIRFLQDDGKFGEIQQGYERSSFWYPSIQLVFQSLFLLPLILVAVSIHRFAQRKGYGLISLMSWHLLVIFFIPLILKVFEFLQVGVLFQFLFDILSVLFGGLLFLASYIYILLIPLLGFGIIKFFQRVVFNPKIQAANRVQKSCCIRCAKQLRRHDEHCPHCGYYQYTECQHCHHLTYKYLPYCKQCGESQDVNLQQR
ncbi:MAG TPA: hypothetical protein V6D10_08465 [Trichocoleus sp.]